MINIVYKDICQQIVSQHYSTFLFQKSFYCFETGISLFFVYEYKFIVYFARSYLRIQLFEFLMFYLLPWKLLTFAMRVLLLNSHASIWFN